MGMPKLLVCLFDLLEQGLIILLMSVDLCNFIKHEFSMPVLIGCWDHTGARGLYLCVIPMLTHARFRSIDISSGGYRYSEGLQCTSRFRELHLRGHAGFGGVEGLLICLIPRIL